MFIFAYFRKLVQVTVMFCPCSLLFFSDNISKTQWMNLKRNLYLVKSLVPESLKLKAKELDWFSLSLLRLLCLLSVVSYLTQEQKYEL